ncbi:MAG: glycosyltransferase family 4 protein [Bdellovibrionia bacterium]
MKKPEVYIDARMVEVVPHGIARYVTRLASGLKRLEAEKGELPYEPVFLVCQDFPQESFEGWSIRRVGAAFLARKELVELPRVLKGASLYHSPSFSSLFSFGPFKVPCPWVVTIHDLNHLSFGSRPQKIYYNWLLKPFAKKAAQVVTVSDFSRREIAQWMGIAADEIEIAYNALDAQSIDPPSDEQCREILSRYQLLSGKYLLCLSNAKPHKNIPFLVEAYREAQKIFKLDWPLVLSMGEFSGVPGVRAVGGLSDTDVRALRAHAGAVVFPSLYEGFGLPPVEAVVTRTPLIVSAIPPHQEGLAELAPEEAAWIYPKDRRSLVEALVKAWQGRIAKPSEQARQKTLDRFSEKELAARMDRIYRRVLDKKA